MDAYFDRLTSTNEAVLLVDETKETIHLAISTLPKNSAPGDWFRIKMDHEKVVSIEKNESKTATMKQSVEQKLAAK